MGAVRTAIYRADQDFDYPVGRFARHHAIRCQPHGSVGVAMNDLLVIGMTIVIFAAFFLLVRVVEHLER
jgi:hypothetical protein